MENLQSHLTRAGQSGGQEHCQPESPRRSPQSKSPSKSHEQRTSSPKNHGSKQKPKQGKRQQPERKRLRHQEQSTDSDTVPEQKHESETKVLSPGRPPSSSSDSTQPKPPNQESCPKLKQERKPQRPGKYVCTYCGRACAKPSVLQKHIRSHTGERPYPCAPCGFSFKTKSNLYKHRKSHTHKLKAGLALVGGAPLDEQITESDDESKQLSSASSLKERTSSVASVKSHETDTAKDSSMGSNNSSAVKKRLALRLSRGKQGLQHENTSTRSLGSKDSTESGYFSHSESTEQPQESIPNTGAKSYAEIILGKYGRLGYLQRISCHNQQPSDEEEKSISFSVPKKQVIDHITKLITINEAVVDTSKIDSVKPRRFSLSRKNSSETLQVTSVKEPPTCSPKIRDLSYKTSGSITMGVPCEKFHHSSLNVKQPPGQTSAPLVRSHSMPTAASSFNATTVGSRKTHQSQSFDEQQTSRRYGMLRRQPAIEISLDEELTKDEDEVTRLFCSEGFTTVCDHKQKQPQLHEGDTGSPAGKDRDGQIKHSQSQGLAQHPRYDVEVSPLVNDAVSGGSPVMRKRRKENSCEFDALSLPSSSGQYKDDSSVACEAPRRPLLQTCSVIQHTSSFDRQESLCNENQGTDETTKNLSSPEESLLVPQKQPEQWQKLITQKLVRQHSKQVPEILVTEDSTVSSEKIVESVFFSKHLENPDKFQWPQRSSSLAQVPIEKLPPKKKRLRLAEISQSSGESSFDSKSVPRSPSQESSASYASSLSTSFEESNRADLETTGSSPLRHSRAPHMLMVPGVHQHRELRRSASEQAPHDPQPSDLITESRSKSFDYGCLSPERTAAGWRERRKCLLMRQTAVIDPDEKEEYQCLKQTLSPGCVTTSKSSPTTVCYSPSTASPLLSHSNTSQSKQVVSQWEPNGNDHLKNSTELSLTPCDSVETVKNKREASLQAPQPYALRGPTGAARASYLPMSTGLKLEIPLCHDDYSFTQVPHSRLPDPHITLCLELLRPITSPPVAVHLQTDTLTSACAIYTTLSQSTYLRPQEALDGHSHNLGNDSDIGQELRTHDGFKVSGTGGNKRMLSPSNSIELLPESQQQQKRVKEEEGDGQRSDKSSVDTCSPQVVRENPSYSFPSLLSSTCNSWCYLNYIKPNPSALDQQTSVYSSWSTSSYDPNPSGLSSKILLSLLHCKQRFNPCIYTLSPMSVKTTESAEQEENKRPCSTEVCNSQSFCRDYMGRGRGRGRVKSSSEDMSSTREEDEEKQKEEEQREEEEEEEDGVTSLIRNKHLTEVSISEDGSHEKQVLTRGESKSEDCRSLVQKCREHSRRFTHSHRSISVQIRGSLTEPQTPKTQGICWNPDHTDKELCKDQLPEDPKYPENPRYSVLGAVEHDEEDRDQDQDCRRDDNLSSMVETSVSRSDGERKQEPSPSTPVPPEDSTQRHSAQNRRALFARRNINPAALLSARGCHSPSAERQTPQRDPFQSRSPSPQAPNPPSSVSPFSHRVSTSPQRPSPLISSLSSGTVQANRSDSCGSLDSIAGTSAQRHGGLRMRDQPSTAHTSVDDTGPTHPALHPLRLRGVHSLLSHLPLHSQQPSRAPNILIPIGGIHMIHLRSCLPLYSLVSSSPSTIVSPTAKGTSWSLQSNALKGSLTLLQQQGTKQKVSLSPSTPAH